jgi:hypothetical protein
VPISVATWNFSVGADDSIEKSLAAWRSSVSRKGSPNKMTGQELKNIFEEEENIYLAMDELSRKSDRQFHEKILAHHVNGFDEKNLNSMLRYCGFSVVTRSRFQQSIALVMRDDNYFDHSYTRVSLNVDAVKILISQFFRDGLKLRKNISSWMQNSKGSFDLYP